MKKTFHSPQDALALRAPEARPVEWSAFNLDLFQGIHFLFAGFAERERLVVVVLLKSGKHIKQILITNKYTNIIRIYNEQVYNDSANIVII